MCAAVDYLSSCSGVRAVYILEPLFSVFVLISRSGNVSKIKQKTILSKTFELITMLRGVRKSLDKYEPA